MECYVAGCVCHQVTTQLLGGGSIIFPAWLWESLKDIFSIRSEFFFFFKHLQLTCCVFQNVIRKSIS